MDDRQFDDLLRSVADSRRTLVKLAFIAIGTLFLRGTESGAKKKKRRKKKKSKGGDGCLEEQTVDGKATPICTPPPPAQPFCNFLDGLIQCQGHPTGSCCEVVKPNCGDLLIPGSIVHLCCPANERWCAPVEGVPIATGFCAPKDQECCTKLSLSGIVGWCPRNQTCCRGRPDTNLDGACCEHGCCTTDENCSGGRVCDNRGCCVPECLPPNVLCPNEECCASGECRPDGSCDIGG